MRYVLDRIEGQHAVLESENNNDLVILKSKLPSSAKEGDVIKYINGIYIVDDEETDYLKNKLNEKMKKLKK